VSYLTAVSALGIGLKTALPFIPDGPRTGLQPSSVLILGGSSGLGAAAIQLLRLAVPACKVLVTASPKHHNHLTSLGADLAFDRSSDSLVEEVKKATAEGRGVDAILDVVGAASTQSEIFEALNTAGLRKYAQVWTGDDEIEAPSGVDSVMFRSRDLSQLQGGKNLMIALEALLKERKYKLPLPVHVVGKALEGLEKGLTLMRKGVSGEKLVVTL
jgi:NADPH:quinone reductase-like Zn-dependent oxidoreductase